MRADTTNTFRRPLSGARWQRHHRARNEEWVTRVAVDAALAVVAQYHGVSVERVRGAHLTRSHQRRGDPMVQARAMALYLTITVFDRPLRAVARALGVSTSGAFYAVRRVEDGRDEPSFDDLLTRLETRLTQPQEIAA